MIFIFLVKVLPHSNFRGSVLLFLLYQLSVKILCSIKEKSFSILIQLVLHNDIASTFVRKCFETVRPKFSSSRPLLFFLFNGYNLLFRAFCLTHFYSLIFAPLEQTRFCMTRNFLVQKTLRTTTVTKL